MFFAVLLITLFLMNAFSQSNKADHFLELLMKKDPSHFEGIIAGKDSFRLQIIYTQINRNEKNKPSFKNFYFNVSDANYFYPASTVKMPVALLALQRLHEPGIPGVDMNSTMITGSDYGHETPVLNDPTTADGRPTIAHYIKKIFLVSDNDAFNRLYEFLGQEYINKNLAKMGYGDAQIRHRLQAGLNAAENAHTNPIRFLDMNGNLLFNQPAKFSQQKFTRRNDFVGAGYYQGNTLINHSMDFSEKNRISLEDLHNILRTVIFPESVPKSRRFRLSADDYKFLYRYLSQYPGETRVPSYDTLTNWDAYCKFLYWGSDTGRLPKNIRIFNKVGDAYGFLIDVSYFVDFDKKIEFMLSVAMYCNKDGILNDDKYDYDDIGLPFMKQLGRLIYDYELKRKKRFAPDLSKFKVQYDK